MPGRGRSASPPEPPTGAEQPDSAGAAVFAAICDAHGAHLFDYCCALTGRQAEAFAPAQAAAWDAVDWPFPQQFDRLRAWLFGRARREILSTRTHGEPGYAPLAVLSATSPAAGAEAALAGFREGEPGWPAAAAFRALPDRFREVLDLVYRHGIRAEDLPDVVGLPTEEAASLLAAAEETFSQLAALAVAPGSGKPAVTQGFGLGYVAEFPLVSLPAAFWEFSGPAWTRTATLDTGNGPPAAAAPRWARPEGVPDGRRLQGAAMAATVLVATGAALGCVAVQGISTDARQTTAAARAEARRSAGLGPAIALVPAASATSPRPSTTAHQPTAAPSLPGGPTPLFSVSTTAPAVGSSAPPQPAPTTRASSSGSSSSSSSPSSSATPSPSASATPSPSASATPSPSASSTPSQSASAAASESASAAADPSASAS